VVFGVGADWLAELQVVLSYCSPAIRAFLGVAKPSMGVEQAVSRIELHATVRSPQATLIAHSSAGRDPFALFISLFE
jgi:hypothetical protein